LDLPLPVAASVERRAANLQARDPSIIIALEGAGGAVRSRRAAVVHAEGIERAGIEGRVLNIFTVGGDTHGLEAVPVDFRVHRQGAVLGREAVILPLIDGAEVVGG